MTEPIFLRPVRAEEKAQLGALLQACLAELAPFYADRPDDRGLFPYPYFEDYFSDPSRRAYFLLHKGAATRDIHPERIFRPDREIVLSFVVP